MKVSNIGTYISAMIVVEAEGYFVERLINLCKINNINIWNIKYINDGKISFNISPKDFKRLKPYIKKSKCKIRILSKNGVYFDMFRYRKRRLVVYLLAFVLLFTIATSTFIWKINLKLDDSIDPLKVNNLLREIKIKKGINKLFISKGRIADYIRTNMYEAAWVGVDIEGQTLNITIKAKIISKEEDRSKVGNIVAAKSGVISKIIAENGTALYKTGSYIEKGSVAIEGIIKSQYIEDKYVHASGVLNVITSYEFEKKYLYKEQIKESTGKTVRGLGVKLNNKDFLIKYLPKENKYDITSKTKKISIFGVNLEVYINTYEEYILKDKVSTKDEIIKKGEQDCTLFFDNLKAKNAKVVDRRVEINETEDGVVYKAYLSVEEEVGEFVKTGE